jgi:hypothetical protein
MVQAPRPNVAIPSSGVYASVKRSSLFTAEGFAKLGTISRSFDDNQNFIWSQFNKLFTIVIYSIVIDKKFQVYKN